MTATAELDLSAAAAPYRMAGSDSAQTTKAFRQLIDKSLRESMDYHLSVPWDMGVDKTKPAKRFEQTWLYHSSAWQRFTPEQQVEITWLETARDVSMVVNLETLIPQLFSTYMNAHSENMSPEIHEYMMIFEREELMHILAFHRYLRVIGHAKHAKMPYFYQLVDHLLTTPPEVGLVFTLLIEWLAEAKVMMNQTEEVDPLTRALWRAHHIDEVRHIHFGKTIAEAWFAAQPPEATAGIRAKLRETILKMVHAVPAIQPHASFPFPCDMNDPALIDEVRASESYRQVIDARFGEIFAWCRKLGIDL
jgi:P-aminobenzoate N-oxygenase AurF